jgi:DNA-binding transcriptional LysR family regulator
MRSAIPSLDLIRGFEAAARHLSFTKAAQELFLTQSAVSRQIKALEDAFGVALFQRRHRALVLTDAGREFLRAAADALRLLEEAAARVKKGDGRRLTVSVTLGFASLWLIPRLHDFRARHPDIDIRIDANNRLVDLARDGVEVAIRYCTAAMAPPDAQWLFGDEVVVVCSPALLKRRPLAQPADLRGHVLLHYDRNDGTAPWATWPVWFEVHGMPGAKTAGSLSFTVFDQMVQAALDGQGVGLAPLPLVRRFVAEKRLVTPLPLKTESKRAYYLLVEPHAAKAPHVQQFIAWLREQAREEVRAANAESAAAKRAARRRAERRA